MSFWRPGLLPSLQGSVPRCRYTAAILVLLSLTTVIPFAFGPLHLDGIRDLEAAWNMIQGGPFPLAGPAINDTFHLGPVWFYILAIPLALTHSLTVALLFAGVLAALKFWLAEALGRQAIDARFGLLFALALALPGWSVLAPVSFTHTVVVETATLAAAYCLLRLAQGATPRWWAIYGLLQTLALHAHPAAVLPVILVPLVAWMRYGRIESGFSQELYWMGIGLLLGFLLFIPPLVFEAERNWQGFERLMDFGSDSSFLGSMAGAPELWQGIALLGPDVIFTHLVSGTAGEIARWIWIALLVAAMIGSIRAILNPTMRRKWVAAFIISSAALLLLASLRGHTPYYMAQAWIPWWCGLVALGWWALKKRWLGAMATGVIMLSVMGGGVVVLRAEQGLIPLPILSMYDVRHDRAALDLPVVPFWRLERFGHELCTASSPVILHGPLALAYHSVLGLPGRMECGDTSNVTVGGGAELTGASHHLGLTPAQLRNLGLKNTEWVTALSLTPDRVIAAAGTSDLVGESTYPFRARQASTPLLEYTFEAAASDWIVFNTLFGAYEESRVVTIEADGQHPEALLQDSVSAVWRCNHCGPGLVRWHLEIRSRSETVDLLVLDPLKSGVESL